MSPTESVPIAGTASGGTRYSCSLAIRNGARLVARIFIVRSECQEPADVRRGVEHLLEVVEQEQRDRTVERRRDHRHRVLAGRLCSHRRRARSSG